MIIIVIIIIKKIIHKIYKTRITNNKIIKMLLNIKVIQHKKEVKVY